MASLTQDLAQQMRESNLLDQEIKQQLEKIGFSLN